MSGNRSLRKRLPAFWDQPTGGVVPGSGGKPETLRDAVLAMKADGIDPRLIDRWIGGFLQGVSARERAATSH